MLTEKEAWLFMAENWKIDEDGDCIYEGFHHFGLCHLVRTLINLQKINENTAINMSNKLKVETKILNEQRPETHYSAYAWPTNENGAIKRINFCKRMIKELNFSPKRSSHGPGFGEN